MYSMLKKNSALLGKYCKVKIRDADWLRQTAPAFAGLLRLTDPYQKKQSLQPLDGGRGRREKKNLEN